MGTNIFVWTFLQQNQYQQTRQCQECKVHQHYTYRQCMDVLQNIQMNKSLAAGISFNLTLVAQWGKEWFVKFNTPKTKLETFRHDRADPELSPITMDEFSLKEDPWMPIGGKVDTFWLKISLKDSVNIFCSSQTNPL